MNLNNQAARLLKDWQQYKHLHYSNKTKFASAVDIEIAKDDVNHYASVLSEAIGSSEFSDQELKFRVNTFARHLAAFKDRITFELLKNGS